MQNIAAIIQFEISKEFALWRITSSVNDGYTSNITMNIIMTLAQIAYGLVIGVVIGLMAYFF